MKYVALKFSFAAEKSIFFPQNPVNTFRGALGYALRRISCSENKSLNDKYACKKCKSVVSCPYALCYETSVCHLPKKIAEKFVSKDIPHLLNIDSCVVGNAEVPSGKRFDFLVNIFGNSVNLVPIIIVAAKNAAETGFRGVRSELHEIKDMASGRIVWNKESDCFKFPELINLQVPEPNLENKEENEIKINFLTPVAFKDKSSGSIGREPEFFKIIGSIMRRYSIFEAIEGNLLNWNFSAISQMAKNVRISRLNVEPVFWERYSTRQQQRIPVSGIIGSMSFIGPVMPFVDLLKSGDIIRCGKSVSLGQGRISVAQIRHLSNRDVCDIFSRN